MKFKKKPVVVDAFQLTKETRVDNKDWPEWMNKAWNMDREKPGSLFPTNPGESNGTLTIHTLEGRHLVPFGNWIIQGVKKEIYSCDPDIFKETYETVGGYK